MQLKCCKRHSSQILQEWRVEDITPNNDGQNICAKHGIRISCGLVHRNLTGSSEEKARQTFGSVWKKSYLASFLEAKTACLFPLLSSTPFCVKHNKVPVVFSGIEFQILCILCRTNPQSPKVVNVHIFSVQFTLYL